MRKLLNDKDERIKMLDNEIQTLLKYRESQADTKVLYQHCTQLEERNTHLQDSLSAETRIKLDLFSALGDVKRQLEIANSSFRSFVLTLNFFSFSLFQVQFEKKNEN